MLLLYASLLMVPFSLHYAVLIASKRKGLNLGNNFYANLVDEESKKINPSISSWVIFSLGTFTSFATYMAGGNSSILGGIMNFIDMAVVVVIVTAIAIFGNAKDKKFVIHPFEKWYLAFSLIILLYWVISGNSFISNVLTQILMTVGYIPLFHTMIKKKINTEPYTPWLIGAVSVSVAMYAVIDTDNILPKLYIGRAFVCIFILLVLMIYTDLKHKTTTSLASDVTTKS